ncbi:AAA family ATPase [Thiomonas sp. FB-6]|jgi:ATP-dependent Lon protease|uniref:AAA family ATPase n=1 Tax=Thiomonas sp. FB-6 TaxID=1158291 RepID=UPI00036F644E|nr:AAA family ATPase [Thiomonas sp. FB-6]
MPTDIRRLPPGFARADSGLVVPEQVLLQAKAAARAEEPEEMPELRPAYTSPAVRSRAWVQEMLGLARQQRPPRGPTLELFTMDDLERCLRRTAEMSDREQKERDQRMLEAAIRGGRWRLVGFAQRTLSAVLALQEEMPHLASVVGQVTNRIRLARAARRPARLPPMLLVGPPGVGKSHFAEQLATALGVSVHRLAMDAVQTTSALAGSDSHWYNSRTGLVFEALIHSGTANPIILLDEVDKVRENSSYHPLSPLHTLLEPLTAKRFADRCIELPLDASHIVWVATANEESALDAPLRSRFAIHRIGAPDAEQGLRVARAIVAQALRELRLRIAVDGAALGRMAGLAPRAQRQAIEEAFGAALARGERVVREDDIPRPPVARSMGFLAQRGSAP